MNRWTNVLSGFITATGFFQEKPEHMNELMETWQVMRADWEMHQADGAFENPMTPAYAPYPYGLVPCEYGLVVTDFVTKTILSAQNHTFLSEAFVYPQADDNDNLSRIRALDAAGRLREVRLTLQREPLWKQILYRIVWRISRVFPGWHTPSLRGRNQGYRSMKGKSLDGLLTTKDLLSLEFRVDVSPFTLEEFEPQSRKSMVDMRARILELGFALSPAEERAWAVWLEQCEED